MCNSGEALDRVLLDLGVRLSSELDQVGGHSSIYLLGALAASLLSGVLDTLGDGCLLLNVALLQTQCYSLHQLVGVSREESTKRFSDNRTDRFFLIARLLNQQIAHWLDVVFEAVGVIQDNFSDRVEEKVLLFGLGLCH